MFALAPATGACEDEIARLCGKVEPGEGRLEDCLTYQLEEEEEGDAKGGWVELSGWEEGWRGGVRQDREGIRVV